MKKWLSSIMVAAIATSALTIPVYASTGHINSGDTPVFSGATSDNVFGDLLDWSGVVFGNANNIIDVEGTLAVGGNFISNNSFSANGGVNGLAPASTEDVALLVNGNVNISGYGNVWGQTVIGNADGNTYKLSNVTPSDTTNGQYTVADASQYFADAKTAAYAAKAAVNALPVNGVCESAYGTYTFRRDPNADVLVYNVDDAVFFRHLFDFTIADGQTVVVNLTTSDKIEFINGAFEINGSREPNYLKGFSRNLIINVVNSTEIEMTSCELYGTLLAPDANLTGMGANVCGTSILNELTGTNGFELHVGTNNSFVPSVPVPTPTTDEDTGETVSIRIDVPLKMAVLFEDGTVYYGSEMKDVIVDKEYAFQMCSVNWDNGIYDENGNGLRGTVVYRMIAVHQNKFNELAREAAQHPERYTVKGIDIIDNEAKKIIINCDATDTHLETDVNNFFVAYRFHFTSSDYNKKTGIEQVINTPLESLSVNLPLGSTITCNAYIGTEKIDTANVFITTNSGEGIYDNVLLTSVNDYTWNH